MTWVWLRPADADFGARGGGDDADERTVWLHADPYAVLGLSPFADEAEVRRAYRRLARLYHPDVSSGMPEDAERFHEIQRALMVIGGDLNVTVEPDAGVWWRFIGFSEPGPLRRSESAVIGLTFEITDKARVPLRNASDTVKVSCVDEVLPLAVSYSGSRFAPPVLLARFGASAESALLALVCLALIPIIASLLALDVFVISDENVLLSRVIAVIVLIAGYGAFVAVLAAAGKPIPDPRRAVFRTREAVATLRSLSKGRN